MKKLDFVIIGVLLAVGALAILGNTIYQQKNSYELSADIYIDGVLYERVFLSDGEQMMRLETPYGNNTLRIFPDGIKMVEADCSSQTCVHTPKQTISGGAIVCLPHKLLVKLSGKSMDGVDVIAG